MQLHNRVLGAAASGLLFIATLSASPAWASHVGSYSKVDQKCRDSIAKVFAKAVKAAGKVSNTCHKSRDKGTVASTTDCNNMAQADTKLKFQKSQTKLTDTIASLCVATGATNDVLDEFTSCPEPCNTTTGVSNPLATYTELGQCLACLAGDIVERSNADMLGSPTEPLSSPDAACHSAIAKGYQKRLSTILKARDGCQKGQDALGNTTLTPCNTSDDKGKIAAALTKAEAGVDSSCASADLANLDSCANTTVSDLKACLLAANDAAGAEGFSSSFELAATVCPVQVNSEILAAWNAPGNHQAGTFLEVGWTGLAHDIDLANGYFVSTNIACPTSPPCGDCAITGVSSNGPQYATFTRCANDFATKCSTPFQPDNVNCGGADCVYVLGPPLPISAANNPTCTINALENDITGTVNPDAGSSSIVLNLLAKTHTGGTATLTHPCPVCVGDPTAGDGLKGGRCRGGSRSGFCDINNTQTCISGDPARIGTSCTTDSECGFPCDVDAYDATFGAQATGEGLALDCPPDPGTNITGVGARIPFNFTTGHTELPFANKCDTPLNFLDCACGVCTLNTTLACRDDTECAAASAGTCTSKGGGVGRVPNGCSDVVAGCVAVGDDKGQCNDPGDDMHFCDGVVRANGNGIVACATNGDCLNSDCNDVLPGLQSNSCGTTCSITQPKPCFLNPIVDDGVPDVDAPSLVGTFCIPPTNNAAINGAAGDPGPARVRADMITHLVY